MMVKIHRQQPTEMEEKQGLRGSEVLWKRMEPNEHETFPADPETGRGNSFLHSLRKCKVKEVFTWHLFKTISMSQGLSVLICGTGISSQYLAVRYSVNTPMLQSFINYVLLLCVYTSILAFRRGDDNLLQILKTKWWKYMLLGIVDVEANYMVVKAYQYTTLTSVQLLDCFVIPVLMALSWFILGIRYRVIHYVAVCICLLGVGAMVGADVLAGRDQGATAYNVYLNCFRHKHLPGDSLVLMSAALYAVSNVCQEYTVKNLSREEFLGMIGMFGTIFSGLQLAILEHSEIPKIIWDWQVALLFAAYALCMFALYSFMPVVIKLASATAVNLSMLTADLFSLFFGLFLFHYKFSGLYILAFTMIVVGFVLYYSMATYTQEPAPQQTAIDGLNNPVSETEDDNRQETAVQFPSGEALQRQHGHSDPGRN
ncbi:solute carrier family 35 member F2-like [Acipenser oxyrinchus oxyrinchus]|uniref:Solute carrier family 35 member F2-like n=1 Tax=Acipenser oxyrinchus oxyrinchus TaxID=40147 RepID=A0AAD8CFH0_ACIOX|nr:solute carrier family 35 member F2-like [Acipenser oxyrinchus oxyrinchus]